MVRKWVEQPWMWLFVGLLAGAWLTNLSRPTSVFAVATDRQENFALATCAVDTGIEAVVTLDFLTGEMNGAVLNPGTRKFSISYHRNIVNDFKLEAGKPPKFAIVTGDVYLRTGSNFKLAPSAIYIAEVNSGKMGVYTFAYNSTTLARPDLTSQQEFVLLDMVPIRSVPIRD